MEIKNPKPLHPGRVLANVFMADYGINQTQLAEKIGCAPNKINEIVNGKRGITPDFALELEKVFKLSAVAWGRMQVEYDVAVAREKAGKRKKRKGSDSGGSQSSSDPVAAKNG